MCEQCDPFFLPVPVGAAAAYLEQVARLRAASGDGRLEVVGGELPPAGRPPERCARLTAACTRCGQLFILERGGCHAFGDQWRPLYGN